MPIPIQITMAAILLVVCVFIANPPAGAAPVGAMPTDQARLAATLPGLVAPAATRLCGRGLGGRCLKGRAACTRGSTAECARWTAWSKACNRCAEAFAKCRSNSRKTCASCIAAHDACEAKAR